MMYCPSSVGTKKCCHVSVGRSTNGPSVVIMCTNRRGITIRSAPLIKNRIPIKHSNSPNPTRKVLKGIKGIVCSNNRCTRALAGLSPTTFNMPNQKNTTNNEILAAGIEIFLKKCISATSNVFTDMY